MRLAMPVMTTLALAPMAVALPPMSAPKARDHHSDCCSGGEAGARTDQLMDQRRHGGDVGDVAHDARQDGRSYQHALGCGA